MRVTEIITESKQIDELDAGKITRGLGKAVKGAATGVGAVAGGVAGAGSAFMKGFRGGKAFVGGEKEPGVGDYGQVSKDGTKIWNTRTKKWEPYDAGENTAAAAPSAATTTGAVPGTTPTSTSTASTNTASSATKIGMKQIKQVVDTMRTRDRQSLLNYLQQSMQARNTKQTVANPQADDSSTVANPAVDANPVVTPTSGSNVKITGGKRVRSKKKVVAK